MKNTIAMVPRNLNEKILSVSKKKFSQNSQTSRGSKRKKIDKEHLSSPKQNTMSLDLFRSNSVPTVFKKTMMHPTVVHHLLEILKKFVLIAKSLLLRLIQEKKYSKRVQQFVFKFSWRYYQQQFFCRIRRIII